VKCRNVEVRVKRSAEVVDESDTEGSDGRKSEGTAYSTGEDRRKDHGWSEDQRVVKDTPYQTVDVHDS